MQEQGEQCSLPLALEQPPGAPKILLDLVEFAVYRVIV